MLPGAGRKVKQNAVFAFLLPSSPAIRRLTFAFRRLIHRPITQWREIKDAWSL